jgi:hypothetical protein
MRKDSTTAKFTQLNMFVEHLLRNLTGRAKYEKERNKRISKVRYIVEQYFGISHLHDKAKRARFTTGLMKISKNQHHMHLKIKSSFCSVLMCNKA